MILLVARCLLVCPGTNRQHRALAGIRSRWEGDEPAACGILHHRQAESNTCCSGLLIRGFGVRVPGGAPGGFHVSPGSMFTFGSDIFGCRGVGAAVPEMILCVMRSWR